MTRISKRDRDELDELDALDEAKQTVAWPDGEGVTHDPRKASAARWAALNALLDPDNEGRIQAVPNI